MFAKGIKTPLLFSILIFVTLVGFYVFIYSSFIPILIGFFLLIFPLYFFRDPERNISDGIASPADGKIVAIDRERNSIEIFMNIWDVHVNRAPVSGTIEGRKHFDGKHSPAFTKKAEQNERHLIQLISDDEREIRIWQIAGVFARRIVSYVDTEESIEKGDRIGMIRFGSKVKLEFSREVDFLVKKGQKVQAGRTKLGEWHE